MGERRTATPQLWISVLMLVSLVSMIILFLQPSIRLAKQSRQKLWPDELILLYGKVTVIESFKSESIFLPSHLYSRRNQGRILFEMFALITFLLQAKLPLMPQLQFFPISQTHSHLTLHKVSILLSVLILFFQNIFPSLISINVINLYISFFHFSMEILSRPR